MTKQMDIENAVRAYVERGDIEPWRRVLDDVRAGGVLVESSKSVLSFRAVTTPQRAAFAEALNALRERVGMTHQEVADATEFSLSAVMRNMRGQALTQWAVVSLMIRAMGGDPEDYRAAYERASAEPLGHPRKPRRRRIGTAEQPEADA